MYKKAPVSAEFLRKPSVFQYFLECLKIIVSMSLKFSENKEHVVNYSYSGKITSFVEK